MGEHKSFRKKIIGKILRWWNRQVKNEQESLLLLIISFDSSGTQIKPHPATHGFSIPR